MAIVSAAPQTMSTAQTKTSAQTKPATLKPAPKPAPTRSSVSRARALARARASAQQRLLREAQTPQYTKDMLGNTVPLLRAAAGVIYDKNHKTVLWESNMHEQRSIASLTKVMTAVTFMNDDPDLDQKVGITRADLKNASVTYLKAGELVTYRDLLHLTLVSSDNAAARVLARTSEGGTAAFVDRMNEFAVNLGLTNTQYVEPSGLDARNVSSAYDLSNLMAHASEDPVLSVVMRTEQYPVRTSGRAFTIYSTNKMLGFEGVDVLSAKTGFISKAGYCLATLLQVPQGSQIAVVVLGAANSTMRFYEAKNLLDWVASGMRGPTGDVPASQGGTTK
jgi:D-alanyl-D-alanine endopeptidase (penicillin-binding protein 7)